jgi:tetratricopeptide (TPR) repeat protein
MEQGDKAKAIEYYNMALRVNTKNVNQKGLSYLRLADLNFKDANYVKAKAYYDSTLTTLPPSFAGTEAIRLKATNLDLLANRYEIISTEDTLQNLASLSEADREVRIGQLVRDQVRKASGQSPATPDTFVAGIDAPGKSSTEGKFYFNNTSALSQGFTDFKRRWGNRKLEDNWRRSSKSAAESITLANQDPDTAPGTRVGLTTSGLTADDLARSFHDNLPLTPSQLQQSNEKKISAYYDIAGFYKDELKDNAEAVKIYQKLLSEYPQNNYLPAIYYNLYRIYSGTDKTRADEYRNIVIARFPESAYAKALLDPGLSPKADGNIIAIAAAYNQAYSLYEQRKYNDVIAAITQAGTQYGQNALSPQFSYLNALAIGRTQKLDIFEKALHQLTATYPDDRLVTPLVQQHLQYIAANRESLAKRPITIIDFDPNEPRFVMEPVADKKQTVTNPIAQNPVPPKAADAVPPSTGNPPSSDPNPVRAALPTVPPLANTMFSLPDSSEYYFVVNVEDPGVNLSSSRFGIGQFNRANFSQGQIKHQLKDAGNENQLIFVGSFFSLSAVKDYERNIAPLMASVMKIPASKYSTFVITKAGLDKLVSRDLINTYIEFYRQH